MPESGLQLYIVRRKQYDRLSQQQLSFLLLGVFQSAPFRGHRATLEK